MHIFAEKPTSLFLDEAIEMDNANRESGVIATEGFQRCHEPFNEVAHEFMKDKRPVLATMISDGFLKQLFIICRNERNEVV